MFFSVGGNGHRVGQRNDAGDVPELASWAADLSAVYIEGALVRALELARQPGVLTRLEDAEYEALEDAERLEAAAEAERIAASADEIAAADARADAERLRRERLSAEGAMAEIAEVAARKAAEVHEHPAGEARGGAADAAQRSGRAQAKTTRTARPRKPRSGKKT